MSSVNTAHGESKCIVFSRAFCPGILPGHFQSIGLIACHSALDYSWQLWVLVSLFVELHEIPFNLFLQLFKVTLTGKNTYLVAIPPSFASSTNFLRVYSVPSPGSLMKTLKSTELTTSPWSALSRIQMDFVMLITRLQAQHFSFQSTFNYKTL